jgi:hypothetical protein
MKHPWHKGQSRLIECATTDSIDVPKDIAAHLGISARTLNGAKLMIDGSDTVWHNLLTDPESQAAPANCAFVNVTVFGWPIMFCVAIADIPVGAKLSADIPDSRHFRNAFVQFHILNDVCRLRIRKRVDCMLQGVDEAVTIQRIMCRKSEAMVEAVESTRSVISVIMMVIEIAESLSLPQDTLDEFKQLRTISIEVQNEVNDAEFNQRIQHDWRFEAQLRDELAQVR